MNRGARFDFRLEELVEAFILLYHCLNTGGTRQDRGFRPFWVRIQELRGHFLHDAT